MKRFFSQRFLLFIVIFVILSYLYVGAALLFDITTGQKMPVSLQVLLLFCCCIAGLDFTITQLIIPIVNTIKKRG